MRKIIKLPTQFIASIIWNLSELTGIGLGRYAKYIFGLMVGADSFKKRG